MATEELEKILSQLLVPNSQAIHQATLQLKNAFKSPELVIPALFELLQKSEEPTIRQYCAILLRRRVVKQWKNIASDMKFRLKNLLLESVTKETIPFVRTSISQVVGSIARLELPTNSWGELMQFISKCMLSTAVGEREVGFVLLCCVCESASEELRPMYQELFQAFEKGLQDPDSKINPFTTIKCIIPLIQFFGTDEEALLKPLLGVILEIIKRLVQEDEEKANEALDIFDELVQIEVGIIVPYVKDLVQFCMQIFDFFMISFHYKHSKEETSLDITTQMMSCNDLSDALRIKALYLVCWACRRKSKTLLKAKLLQPLVKLLLALMSTPSDEEEEGDQESGEEMNSLQSVAGQALDLLALHTSPNKLVPILMEELRSLFSSTNMYERKASYIALGELAEGCADYIRYQHLQNAIETAMKGLNDEAVIVRNAALFALGQYSEHVQPEIGKFHNEVLPVLLIFLEKVINDPNSASNHKGTVTKLFYAIEKFTEGLEKDVVAQYTQGLMDAYFSLLKLNKDIHTSELAISAIGALVSSAQEHLTCFFGTIMEHLKVFLLQPLTLETMDIHAQTVDTLGALARYISPDTFLPVADECMQFGLKMIEDCEDPDLRRCTYGLFSSISVVLKEAMESYLATIIPMMILSLKSTEGIVANYDANNDPTFLIEDECDEEVLTNGTQNGEEEDDDDEDITGYSVENAYMDEKEDTINSLAEICENTGKAFMGYMAEVFKEIYLLIDYPHSNVRKASVTAGIRICIVLYKLMKENSSSDLTEVHNCVNRSLPTAINIINKDDDRYVVLACLEVLEEFLKTLKGDAFTEKIYVDEFANALLNVFRGKTHCQEFFDEDEGSVASGEDDSTQAELDQMLVEKTGDLLPLFAQAIGGEHFKNYFTVLMPELIKKARKNSSVAERSFAAGTMAEIIQAMKSSISEYIQIIAPWLLGLLGDADEEVRSNASFALGVMAESGSDVVVPLYPTMLQGLFTLLTSQQQPPLVQDNICGAVSRMIMASPESVPMDQVFPVLVGCLPIKEDERENDTAAKCVMQIYATNSTVLLPYMEKLLPWFVMSLNNEKSGLEDDTREKLKLVINDIQSKYPNEVGQLLGLIVPLA